MVRGGRWVWVVSADLRCDLAFCFVRRGVCNVLVVSEADTAR